jgi:magnesium-transporting ATPase (P-type)
MELLYFRWLIDFGLVVLIVIVQMVIYPSFKFYEKPALEKWHAKYTSRIFYIVFPLMMAQLVLSIIMILSVQSLYTIASLSSIVLLFLMTFLIFVPLHNAISKGKATTYLLRQLVRKNWLRTILWVLIFLGTSFELFLQ